VAKSEFNTIVTVPKTNRFRALLGAIQVLGKLKTIRLVELQELKDISNFRTPDLWRITN